MLLFSDPDTKPNEGFMEFRLTYEGPLYGAGNNNNRTSHKHEIRKYLHKQLKFFWDTEPRFKESGPKIITIEGEYPPRTVKELSENFSRGNYNFVPLVTEKLLLSCHLDILFLTNDFPGGLVKAHGDIDNKLKTLFDALRIPSECSEMQKYPTPEEDEKPFFCLLEDDRLITSLSVEKDRLLTNFEQKEYVKALIKVTIRPYHLTMFNIHVS